MPTPLCKFEGPAEFCTRGDLNPFRLIEEPPRDLGSWGRVGVIVLAFPKPIGMLCLIAGLGISTLFKDPSIGRFAGTLVVCSMSDSGVS